MTRYLLDTNIVFSMVKYPRGPSLERLKQVGENEVYTSIIVAAELRFGISKARSRRLGEKVERRLSRLIVVPFASPADVVYGDLRAELERFGQPIGRNDLLIAAQALHDGSVLVTDNEREFGRVPGLRVENRVRP